MSDSGLKVPSQVFRWFEKMKANYENSVQELKELKLENENLMIELEKMSNYFPRHISKKFLEYQ